MKNQTIRDVQEKILIIMKFIDEVCRKNDIIYYLMGGTALGAVRHGGFIPWDDDLDIFMNPQNYNKFKNIFNHLNNDDFVLQEWRTVPEYLEYSKVRMNGTTFIEKNLKDRKDLHHGIYVDIMILHKVPKSIIIQKILYYQSKYVTLYGLSKRNWQPHNFYQKSILNTLKLLPNKMLLKWSYKNICRYDNMNTSYKYCYWITPAKFNQGIFDPEMFSSPVDMKFEDAKFMVSKNIIQYLEYRYGDYMIVPTKEQQSLSVHAEIYDVNNSYENYINESKR